MKYAHTDVSEFERDLKVAGELKRKLRVHLENVEQIVAMNFVQIAVSQRSHVAARLSNGLIHTYVLSKDVVFTCRKPLASA